MQYLHREEQAYPRTLIFWVSSKWWSKAMIKSGSEPMSHGFITEGALSWAEAWACPRWRRSLQSKLISVPYSPNNSCIISYIYICTETPHKSKPKHNFNVNRQLIHNLHEDSKYYHITGNLLQLWLFICSHLQRTRLQNIQNLSKADKSKINISYLCHSIESQANISTTEKLQN